MVKKVSIILIGIFFFGFILVQLFGPNNSEQTTEESEVTVPINVLRDGRYVQDVQMDVTRERYTVSIRRYRFLGLHNPQSDAAAEIIVKKADTEKSWGWIDKGFDISYGTQTRKPVIKLKEKIDRNTRRYDILMTVLPSDSVRGSDRSKGDVGLVIKVPGGPFTVSIKAVLPPNTELPQPTVEQGVIQPTTPTEDEADSVPEPGKQ